MKYFLIPAFLILFGVINNMYQYGYGANDAFWRVVWAIDEGTLWSPGFSERNFNKIRVGMSRGEVLEIMGDPLHGYEDCQKNCFWSYTKQDSGTSDFDQRWVIFDENYKVSEVRKSFYID